MAGLPDLERLAARWAGSGVEVLVVSVDDPKVVFDRYRGFGEHYRPMWGGPGVLRALRLSGVPATFVIDERGIVRAFQQGALIGEVEDTRLDRALEAIVGDPG